MAKEMVINGKSIKNDPNINQRIFNRIIIETLKQIPDIIVLGSSRVMGISKYLVSNDKNKSFFNHGLTAASLEDIIAILGIYLKDKGNLPKNIIIGIDNWVFIDQEKANHTEWQTLSDYYGFYMGKKLSYTTITIKNGNSMFHNYRDLIGISYTKYNIKKYNTSLQENVTGSRISDGAINLPGNAIPEIVERDIVREFEENARATDNAGARGQNNVTVSRERTELFEKLIKSLVSSRVNVIIYLPPYHPKFYEISAAAPWLKTADQIEAYLRLFCNRHNIKVIGSYNPGRLDLLGADFYDSHHGVGSMYEKIFLHDGAAMLIE
jgi:hypothetical protein